MIRRTAAAAAVGLALGLVAGVGACTTPADTLDTTATERAVERTVEPRLPVRVDEVRCPSPIERRDGATTTCRAVLADEGGSVRVNVTQRGDGQRLEVELYDVVLDRAAVGRQLHDALVSEYARSFTVDCGGRGVAVLATGASISCTATDDAGRRKVSATVLDARGTLRFDLSGAGA